MRRAVGRLLLAAFIVLYGAASFCGPALHAIPGLGHADGRALTDGDGSESPASTHDDCPVCHFLAQGQLAVEDGHEVSVAIVRAESTDGPPLISSRASRRPSIPRAPPRV